MPDYKDKTRLKQYMGFHKEISTLIENLILNGYSDNEIEFAKKHGILSFVEEWEEAVDSMMHFYGYEEYDYDLYSRTKLYDIMMLAAPENVKAYEDRIAGTDQKYFEMTIPCNTPFRHIDNPDPEEHWWLFRERKGDRPSLLGKNLK